VADAESLLEQAGCQVDFPPEQVCCGQPAFNAGHRAAARRVARTFVRAFSRDHPVVCASGSCVTMVTHYLPELLGCDGPSRSADIEQRLMVGVHGPREVHVVVVP
jgi:L-lactate dehydrogenase complex protein LldE